MKQIALLGSTGSIGTQVLDVVCAYPEHFQVVALSAGKNLTLLYEQIRTFRPQAVCVQDEADRPAVVAYIASLSSPSDVFSCEVFCGEQGLMSLASLPSITTLIVGLVGMIGLPPTLAACQAGKQVLTANKETFVAGGHLVAPFIQGQIIPIDSEHSAIHQCLQQAGQDNLSAQARVQTIYLTASGGPFRMRPVETFSAISKAEALQHPNWTMGQKITIDSATLMNKGLEVIEAHWLFGAPFEKIQVVIHPESIIHSGVELVDGSILVQMGPPDMHGPIQYAMTYPERLPCIPESKRLDLLSLNALHFDAPDLTRFPCLALAYEAGRKGPAYSAVLNAADEVVVSLFLQDKLSFVEIPKQIALTLKAFERSGLVEPFPSLEAVVEIDAWARCFAQENRTTLVC